MLCSVDLNVVGVPVRVVDLGSRPAVLSSVESLVKKFHSLQPWRDMALIHFSRDIWSRAVALNTAARSYRPTIEYFIFTDADMIFPPEWIAKILPELRPDRVLLTRTRDLSAEVMERFTPKDLISPTRLWTLSTPHSVMGQGGAMVVPSAWFQKAGGFDEFYQTWGAEENDLVFRAQWDGLDVRWATETFVCHQWHPRDWATPEDWERINANRCYLAARIREHGPITRNAAGYMLPMANVRPEEALARILQAMETMPRP